MKITKDNYFQKVNEIGLAKLSPELKEEHAYVEEATEKGTNWSFYEESQDIQEVIDHQFGRLESFLTKQRAKTEPKRQAKMATPVQKESKKPEQSVKQVERIDEQVRFIKRYVLMDGKVKTKPQILSFVNALQKAILDKRIRRTSIYADEIRYIQDNLLSLYNQMSVPVLVEIKKDKANLFHSIGGSEKIRLSVSYMKRYIGIQGKGLTKEKAKVLYALVNKAVATGKISKSDPYFSRIQAVLSSLKQFLSSSGNKATLKIHSEILNGIHGALNGLGCPDKKYDCKSLNGVMSSFATPEVMNSVDFAKLNFESLGFDGKWLELIGDPSKGFTAMVFGKPKMGKSYLCIDFAGYLARKFGKVLYVAKEETLNRTLQDKLKDKNVVHPNLMVSSILPDNLFGYQFVFLDSVNKLQLSANDLEDLKSTNPAVSFIYVFQSTKEGNFRGGNEFQHDVDVVIEVPERGKAVQFGRFNQGGEIRIF